MSYTIFADESGTDNDSKCYTIGALVIESERIKRFGDFIDKLKKKYGVIGEAKWNRVSNMFGHVNFGIELFRAVLGSGLRYASIVVKKSDYRKWADNKEEAFYSTYSYVLRHAVQNRGQDYSVWIDDRSDTYKKQHEKLQVITNHMLRGIRSRANFSTVTKESSTHFPGIQAVDYITGAVNSAHNSLLDGAFQVNPAKQTVIRKFAEMLGWDTLHYDTWPNDEFNIWHFPDDGGYRAYPATKKVKLNLNVELIPRMPKPPKIG
jgi:hypothetical protein